MCGISGLIFKNKSNNDDFKKKFTNFTSLIDYRGPDHHQIKTFDNILLSSHRLSIFDPSTKSNMPMTYMKNFHIVFNGFASVIGASECKPHFIPAFVASASGDILDARFSPKNISRCASP